MKRLTDLLIEGLGIRCLDPDQYEDLAATLVSLPDSDIPAFLAGAHAIPVPVKKKIWEYMTDEGKQRIAKIIASSKEPVSKPQAAPKPIKKQEPGEQSQIVLYPGANSCSETSKAQSSLELVRTVLKNGCQPNPKSVQEALAADGHHPSIKQIERSLKTLGTAPTTNRPKKKDSNGLP